MPLIPPWAGEGSLPADVVAGTGELERQGWAALRSLQGDPVADVLRYEVTGGDPARGIAGTRTLVPGLDEIPVLWNQLTRGEAERRGVVYVEGIIGMEMYTDVEVKMTDLIRLKGVIYDVKDVHYDEDFGRTEVYATVRPGGEPA
jgi:hypothetical protein